MPGSSLGRKIARESVRMRMCVRACVRIWCVFCDDMIIKPVIVVRIPGSRRVLMGTNA